MAAAFGIGPADDHEFLAIETFDLQPGTPIRLIPAVHALGDDPFELVLAGRFVKGRSVPDLVIVEADRRRHARQQLFQFGLAFDERQTGHVFAVQEQKIEQEED